MSLFSRFFGREPVAPVDMSTDTSVASRPAAIEVMQDGQLLRQLAGLTGRCADMPRTDESLQKSARLRLASLIDDEALDIRALMTQSADPLAVVSLVALCRSPDRLPLALAGITEASQRMALVTSAPSSRLRQLAAETIEDPDELRQLIKRVRDSDKGVYKILKQKSAALLADERRRAELTAEIDALSSALDRHSRRAFDPAYISTFEHLGARWLALTTQPHDDVARRVAGSMERCRQNISAQSARLAQLQAQLEADQAAREAAWHDEDVQRRKAQAAQAELRESEAVAQAEAAADLAAKQAEDLLQRAARQQVEREHHGHLETMLRKICAVLSDGDTKRASAMRRSLEQQLAGAAALPAQLERQLRQLDDKLRDLKQWKEFAAAPKRTELIAEMESLIGCEDEPKLLAGRIRGLQDEWRTINKGIVGDQPAETQRFHRAAQSAFKPCREYFEAEAARRLENLEKRKTVLERLKIVEAGQTPENFDWRLVSQVLREAPQEWRSAFPVERDARRELQDEFDSCLKHLKSILAAWYEHNVAQKQSLIEQTRQLLERTDSRDTIDAVKNLQARWKETQPAPRDQDRLLWTQFHDLCDGVYKKRQQACTDHIAALDANKDGVVALCEEVEGVALLAGPDLAAGVARIPQWRAAFAAVGELPRADARSLRERFEHAVERCMVQVAEHRAREGEQANANLAEASRLIRACQWAAACAAPASQQTALGAAASAFIEGTTPWPKGALAVLRDVLAHAQETRLNDAAIREKALRMLCIRCEIITGMTTDAADQTLRREYQVQRLVQGMGQGNRAQDVTSQSAMLEWLRIAAVSPDAHARLQQRFLQCLTRMNLRHPVIG